MQPDNVTVPGKRTEVEQHLFTILDLPSHEQSLIHDLARNAAQKAIESAKCVAETVPEPWMIDIVFLSSLLLIGQAANNRMAERAELAMQVLGPEGRAAIAKIIEENKGKQGRESGVRDFDGKRS